MNTNNNKTIKVSIICNTYNHRNYISKALDGFLSQKTNFGFEVLVHDDASTDGTIDVIKTYEKRFPNVIKPIFEKVNQHSKIGFTSRLQQRRALGQYIAICEGDDYWTDPFKLQKQIDFLDSNNEYVGCVHKYIVVNQYNEEQSIVTFGYYKESGCYSLDDFQQKELPSQLSTLVYRNIYLDNNKGYPQAFYNVKIQGDIKLYLWLLTQGNIYRMDDTMSAYRFVNEKTGNSWTSVQRRVAFGNYYHKGLCSLEKAYFSIYGTKISLKKRKKDAIIHMFSDFKRKPCFSVFMRTIAVIFIHPLVFIQYLLARIKRKIHRL